MCFLWCFFYPLFGSLQIIFQWYSCQSLQTHLFSRRFVLLKGQFEENQSRENRTSLFSCDGKAEKSKDQNQQKKREKLFKWHTSIKVARTQKLVSWHEWYWWIEINKSLNSRNPEADVMSWSIAWRRKSIAMNNNLLSRFTLVHSHKSHRRSHKFRVHKLDFSLSRFRLVLNTENHFLLVLLLSFL